MRIQTKNTYLEVVTHGDKSNPCMILVRGLGSQLIQWENNFIQGFVDKGYYVVTFDNRDIGLSEKFSDFTREQTEESIGKIMGGKDAPAPYSTLDMADDVVNLMDVMGIKKAHVYGASMGGMIVQILAHNYPKRFLSATIVMSSNGKEGLSEMSEDVKKAFSAKLNLESEEDVLEYLIKQWKISGSKGFPISLDVLRANMQKVLSRGYHPDGQARQWLAILKSKFLIDAVAYNENTKIPCLVLHGQEDALIGVDHGKCIAEHIPNARFKSWAGWGHDNPPEMSDPIVAEVTEFIDSIS